MVTDPFVIREVRTELSVFHPFIPVVEVYLLILLVHSLRCFSLKRAIPANAADVYGRRTYCRWITGQLRVLAFQTIRYTVDFGFVIGIIMADIPGRFINDLSAADIRKRSGCIFIIACIVMISSLVSGWEKRLVSIYNAKPFDFRKFIRGRAFNCFIFSGSYLVCSAIMPAASPPVLGTFHPDSAFPFWLLAVSALFPVARAVRDDRKLEKYLAPVAKRDLADKIDCLVQRSNIPNLQVRILLAPGKPNASFHSSPWKRIVVLNLLLLDEMSEEEICACVAHEIGHAVHYHPLKALLREVISYSFLTIIGWICLTQPSAQPLVRILTIGAVPGMYILTVIKHWFSQKEEFFADCYAVNAGYGDALKASLKKVTGQEIRELNPVPLYSLLVSTHPDYNRRLMNIERAIQLKDE